MAQAKMDVHQRADAGHEQHLKVRGQMPLRKKVAALEKPAMLGSHGPVGRPRHRLDGSEFGPSGIPRGGSELMKRFGHPQCTAPCRAAGSEPGYLELVRVLV